MNLSKPPNKSAAGAPRLPSSEVLPAPVAERLVPIGDAAVLIGIHVWALQRAVKRGDVPSYRAFNSRRLVRISEVLAAINTTRQGGTDV